jgi:hypothetical protein
MSKGLKFDHEGYKPISLLKDMDISIDNIFISEIIINLNHSALLSEVDLRNEMRLHTFKEYMLGSHNKDNFWCVTIRRFYKSKKIATDRYTKFVWYLKEEIYESEFPIKTSNPYNFKIKEKIIREMIGTLSDSINYQGTFFGLAKDLTDRVNLVINPLITKMTDRIYKLLNN